MKKFLISIIKLYQKMPISSHYNCRFIPSCSEYGIEAINKHGSLKGSFLTIKRILKCNPLTKPGYDPVPDKEKFYEKTN